MTCKICSIAGIVGKLVGQYIFNWANLLDHALNTLLLGDANETVSARTARARNAGSKTASVFCNCLTFVFYFGNMKKDHCAYALDASVKPNSKEIWDWSNGVIRNTPVNEIDDVEVGPAN